MMLDVTERISEHKDQINERKNIGLESNRRQKNKHDEAFKNKHHSFGEADFVLHCNSIFQNLFKLLGFVFLKNIDVFVVIHNVGIL
jgi:hypothetical protein